MNARELVQVGRLTEARREAAAEVKAAPSDAGKRTLLFQTLAFCGEWDKADAHLDVLASQSVQAETGVQLYKGLLAAERERDAVLAFDRLPAILPRIPAYLDVYVAARRGVETRQAATTDEMLQRADSLRPPVTGKLDGGAFDDFRDTDGFLEGFLEAMVHGHYVWIPFESLRELSIPGPKTLMDLLWTPARVTTAGGLTMHCHLPVRYPGSHRHEDDGVRLGRLTDWTAVTGSYLRAAGQHVFEAGEREIALLEIREATFDVLEAGESHEPAA
jgi:type VI secretion system protein ImpE